MIEFVAIVGFMIFAILRQARTQDWPAGHATLVIAVTLLTLMASLKFNIGKIVTQLLTQ